MTVAGPLAIIDEVAHPFKRDNCRDQGCSVTIDPPKTQVAVIDCEAFKEATRFPERLCDCVVVWRGTITRAYALELKSGAVRNAIEQIENGIRLLDKWLTDSAPVHDVLPTLVHKGGLSTNDVRILRQKRKVSFRGRDYPILQLKCGQKLTDIGKSRHG